MIFQVNLIMKNIIRNLVVLCLMLMLIACGDSDSKNKSDSQKVYDYRDEHNQDFFSHYMRKTQKDYLIIESKNMEESRTCPFHPAVETRARMQ